MTHFFLSINRPIGISVLELGRGTRQTDGQTPPSFYDAPSPIVGHNNIPARLGYNTI